MRRLPVYLLLDVSGSMRGKPIAAVNNGISMLVDTIRCDPYALETVFLSLIVFNNTVEQKIPLTEIYKFRPPTLEAQLGTYLGKALKFLSARAEEEVVRSSTEIKGDWKPLVFIMTDGRSGDKISKALNEFNKAQFGNIIICVTGKDPKIDELSLISENLVFLNDMSEENIKSFFKWVSASVASTSMSIINSGSDYGILNDLPPLPVSLEIMRSSSLN